MIGAMVSGQMVYVNADSEGAPVSDGMISVTLVANCITIGDTDYLDMAGFGDKRDYIGVYGVSYCLQRTIVQGKRIRFLITISEEALRTGGRNDATRTFQIFLSLFDVKRMTPEIKEEFFRSCAMLVTRSHDAFDRGEILRSYIKDLSNPSMKIKKRTQIHDLLNHIYEENKIINFSLAKSGIPCPPCTDIEFLKQQNWKGFNLKELDDKLDNGRSIFRIPFKKDFRQLTKA